MNKHMISRRDFLKGTAAAGIAMAAGSLLGPNTSAAAEGVTESAPKKYDVPTDGRYVTKAMGHENWIYVATSIREGKITECRVISHEETMGIGSYACARIPAAIVAAQSFNVPNLKGSSFSSRAIKNAVKEAIELSGYNVDDFSAEVPVETVNEAIEDEYDVVIMGAGTAGLIAAVRLLEKGKKVIVVEKNAIPGGSMAMTYGASSPPAASSSRTTTLPAPRATTIWRPTWAS